MYHILSSIVRTFYIENDAEIFPVQYTWEVAVKGFEIAFMMNKLAIIISFDVILIVIVLVTVSHLSPSHLNPSLIFSSTELCSHIVLALYANVRLILQSYNTAV